MDVARTLAVQTNSISCIDMHTCGEPTRIVLNGYPDLSSTLLEQRAEATRKYDHIRRKLVLEPRGHSDMYGAILRSKTEQTLSGAAHMGVLFLTNDGYSTMCGHATIALGRFLLDTHDENIFPQRRDVKVDLASRTARLVLHCPCGLVEVTVPVNEDGSRSDPTRPVSHISVPSFATGVNVNIPIPKAYGWPELGERTQVTADFSYGGAFYCFVTAEELGFPHGLRGKVEVDAMNVATRKLKAAINQDRSLTYLFSHPDHADLGFLYSVIIVDRSSGQPIAGSTRAETGLCFFADQQIDRSPTGSGVAARIALAYAIDRTSRDEVVTYHSLLSEALDGKGAFVGSMYEHIGATKHDFPIVRVNVEGSAFYTGTSTFVLEKSDPLGDDGFIFDQLST